MIVLDAGAFLALVKREKGGFELRRLLDAHREETFIHSVNELEIFYGIERDYGRAQAERVWDLLDRSKIVVRTDFDRDFLRDASLVKNTHRMSLADTFGIAFARRLNCSLVSTDHHELDAVHAAGVCDVIFIR